MPKDEFALDDPMALRGVSLPGDRLEEMARCFIEEYLRLGYTQKQVLRFFQDPFYVATHKVWLEKGETYVRRLIAQTVPPPETFGASPGDPLPGVAAEGDV